MSLKALDVYWRRAKSTMRSFTRSDNWKYALAFALGSLLSFIGSFQAAKYLTGYSTNGLITSIVIKSKEAKFRKALKYDGFSVQPTTRPSTEAMAWDNLFRSGEKAPKDAVATRELYMDKKSKFYWETLKNNFNAQVNDYTLPPFMKTPTKKVIDANWNNSNFELAGYLYEYPGCSLKNGIIYYIHGGGFFLSTHREADMLLCLVMQYTECPVLSLEYDLCKPEGDGIPALVDQCVAGYQYILNELKVDNKKISIMGCSAGGTLTLLTAQKINALSLPAPCGVVCVSPVGDVSGNVMYETQEKENIHDAMLYPVGFGFCRWVYPSKKDREKYNGDEDKVLKLPSYSPLYGEFKGLCPIYLSGSLNEVLIGDCKAILKRCQEANVDVEYRWDVALPHVTVCFAPLIPEARDSAAMMIQWMKNKLQNTL